MLANMSVISMALLALLPLLLAPSVQAFFWSCPAMESDDSVDNLTVAQEALEAMFPAKVYLKKGNDEEKMYSCITIEVFESMQEPPPPPAEERWFMSCLFGGCADEDESLPYNSSIIYYMGGEEHTAYTNISIMEVDDALVVTMSNVPSDLFGEQNGNVMLRLANVGNEYVVLIDCNNYFLSFGHTKHAYMLVSPNINMEELMQVDWHCMAEGLGEATDTDDIIPGGICMTPAS
ncbi:hypothetical protein FHG87_013371 [Trinorchestia longiramus]|nr:hypothetical protein FHG87_013371 [Trinorchestia longiramus]